MEGSLSPSSRFNSPWLDIAAGAAAGGLTLALSIWSLPDVFHLLALPAVMVIGAEAVLRCFLASSAFHGHILLYATLFCVSAFLLRATLSWCAGRLIRPFSLPRYAPALAACVMVPWFGTLIFLGAIV